MPSEMAYVTRAIRGATTLEVDTPEQVTERIHALLARMMELNSLQGDDLVSIIFTATGDITSMFPAAAARSMGLGDVPLMCARELDVKDSMPMCLRVLMHVNTEAPRSAIHHVYLERARALRDDLPE